MTPLAILLAAVFLVIGNLTVLPKSFTGAFSSSSRLDVRKVYGKSRERYRDILRYDTLFNVDITLCLSAGLQVIHCPNIF